MKKNSLCDFIIQYLSFNNGFIPFLMHLLLIFALLFFIAIFGVNILYLLKFLFSAANLYKTITIFVVIGIISFILVLLMEKLFSLCDNSKCNAFIAIAFIGILALTFRLAVGFILLYNNYEMFSDYLYAYNAVLNYKQLIPLPTTIDLDKQYNDYLHFCAASYWGMHIAFMNKMADVFGDNILLINNIINSFVDSASAILLFVLGYKLFSSIKIAIVSSCLYAFYPVSIIYCSWFTGEFIGVFFMLLGCTCVICCIGSFQNSVKWLNLKQIILLILASIAWTISNCFKPVVIVMLVSLCSCFFLYCLHHIKITSKSFFNRKIIIGATGLLLLSIVFYSGSQITLRLYESHIGCKTKKGNIIVRLYQGLNPEYNGVYSKDFHNKNINIIKRFKNQRESIRQQHWMNFKKDVISRWYALPKVLINKTIVIFGTEDWLTYRIGESFKNAEKFKISYIGQLITEYSNFYNIIIYLGIVLSILYKIKHEQYCFDYDFIFLAICAGTLLLLLIEAQARYKISMLVPLFILLASYGIGNYYNKLSKINKGFIFSRKRLGKKIE